MVALTVKTDDEHGASVAVANGLVGGRNRRVTPFWGEVPNTLAKTTMTEFLSAAKKLDRKVRSIGS
jgi:hypothetical protein